MPAGYVDNFSRFIILSEVLTDYRLIMFYQHQRCFAGFFINGCISIDILP